MVINGNKMAQDILDGVRATVAELPFTPVFCDVLVGNNPVSLSYVKIKGKKAEQAGISFVLEQLPQTVSQEEVIEKITRLNKITHMCGLIVQLPLPPHINRQLVLDVINPALDVDCLGSQNTGDFYNRNFKLVPPTAAAIMEIVDGLPEQYHKGKFVVIGNGQLVGRPVSELLRARGVDVVIANSSTIDLPALCREADVLITATGQASLVTKGFIKPGAAVIDAGTAEMDGGIVGDVEYQGVSEAAGYITPVPGGVGPITVAMLLKNVVTVARSLQ